MSSARKEELVKHFLASNAFDFAAFGKFVAENGTSIASSGAEFGFVIGNRFIRYCIPPEVRVIEGINPSEVGVRTEVTGL